MNIETYWDHQASRSIWELENLCMKGKCVICKLAFKLGYGINKGDTEIDENYI